MLRLGIRKYCRPFYIPWRSVRQFESEDDINDFVGLTTLRLKIKKLQRTYPIRVCRSNYIVVGRLWCSSERQTRLIASHLFVRPYRKIIA